MTTDEQAVMRRYMSYYFCLVTLIDEYVGKLIETLEEHDILDDTLIIYTSDHGEMLGDFARFGKGNFYEPVVHVPLIGRPPGGCEPRHTQDLAEVMDIAPTILDYAEIDRPDEMQAKTLRPMLEGKDGGHEAVLSEYTSNDRRLSGKCLITQRYKYILWDTDDGGEFYDLQDDPRELRNLYHDPEFRGPRDEHAEILLRKLMQSEWGYCGGRTEPY